MLFGDTSGVSDTRDSLDFDELDEAADHDGRSFIVFL